MSSRLGSWNRICGVARLPFISCNISSRQLAQADLVGEVAAALREYGVPRDRLMLELTETSLMQNPETGALTIRKLRDLGIAQRGAHVFGGDRHIVALAEP